MDRYQDQEMEYDQNLRQQKYRERQNQNMLQENQTIIDNNGFGGNQVVQERSGMFGRDQTIVDNNGFGGSEVVEDRRGLFGRDQTIVDNNGFGGNQVVQESSNMPITSHTNVQIKSSNNLQKFSNKQQKVIDQQYYNKFEPLKQSSQVNINISQGIAIKKQEQFQLAQNPQTSLIFSSFISIHHHFQWKSQEASLQKFLLKLPQKSIPIRQITKLKCLSQIATDKKRKLKITRNQSEDIMFGADIEEFKIGLPLQYAWFAKLICSKLTDMGYDLQRPINIDNKEFNIKINNVYSKGMIFKRSQHLKKWERRYIVINNQGLFSYKSPNENYSFSIKAASAKYIWTRFELFDNQLIIKIKHGLQQTQFALPIVNFCRKNADNWLFSFYRMIMERNISKGLN